VLTPTDSLPATLVMGPFHINDTSYNEMHINDTVYLNTTETWSIVNHTEIAHPFHVHDMHFYVHSINQSITVPIQDQGRKDVVLVMPGDSVTFVTKFEDFADPMVPYMYHCHLLHHEDDGMMGSFVVLDTVKHVGIQETIQSNDLQIFPNPCTDHLTINSKRSFNANSIRCWNILGTEIPLELITENTLNTSNLNDGIYVIEINQQRIKFIKTH
jgi:bilirubin oxidase